MKILLIRNLNPFFDSSASGNRFASLVSGLSKLGVGVTILVTGGYNTHVERKQLGRKGVYNGVNIEYAILTSNHSIWWKRFNKYILSGLCESFVKNKVKKYIKQNEKSFDYIWLTNNTIVLSSYLDICSELLTQQLIEINEFHDIYKESGKVTNNLQLAQAQKTEKLFLDAIMHIDCFAMMTRTLIDFYRTRVKPSAKIFHLPMTVDMERFNRTKKNNVTEKYIAFAGSFDNRKDGLNILIESFARIHAKYPEYRLKIAGFYHPDVENQKRTISENGLQEKVEYIGTLNREQIPQFLVDASVLALSRPDSHQAQGGFPTKLGEYLSTKNPVCVTRVGEIPEYLTDGENAFLAEPGNVESFASALERAILDSLNGCKVGLAGYEVAKANFNMDVQAKRFYEFLIDNKK